MAGRADFLVDLEAALELLAVELAERPVAGERQLLGMLVELVLGRRLGGLADDGRDAAKNDISSTTDEDERRREPRR